MNYRNSADINSSTWIRDSLPLGTTHPITQHHMPEGLTGSKQHFCEPQYSQDTGMLKIPRQSFQFTLYSVKSTLTIQKTYKLGITSSVCHLDTKL